MYTLFILKRMLEDIIIFPFVLWGRINSRRHIQHQPYDIIFIFPFYHTGGAEKVHLEIAKVFSQKKCLILFTRKSADACFKEAFELTGHDIIDISSFTDNKFKYWNKLIWRGIISALIHAQSHKTVIFNGQSNFGYKLSRWVSPTYKQIELIHSFNSFSWIRIPFIRNYAKTIMISHKAIDQHRSQYKKLRIPNSYLNRIVYINNGIALEKNFTSAKVFEGKLRVLYVGRATNEKRPALFAHIAQFVHYHSIDMDFEMAGDIAPFLNEEIKNNIVFHGPIHDSAMMTNLYDQADIVMITSSEEGFPLVVMEAMARGCIIISTPVGDIPHHIQHGENGFLFSSANDEQRILEESMLIMRKLNNDRGILKHISQNNVRYAQEHFDLGTFATSYRTLLESINV